MTKALKIMNIVIPSVAAGTCAIAPLAVFGAEQAYNASHFDVSYEKDVITLSNPHAVLHKDFRTIITPVDTTMVVSRVEVFIGGNILNPEDYIFNSETGELFIIGEYIDKTSIFIYPFLIHEGKFYFSEGEEGLVKEEYVNDFTWQFSFSDDYVEPEDLKVIPSIEKVSGIGTLVSPMPEEFIVLSHDDAAHVWNADVDLKFETLESIPQSQQFKISFHYISGASGRPIDQNFSEVFTAKLESV